MANSEPDPDGFRPVTNPNTGKKAKTTTSGAPRKKPEIESDIRVIFQLPQNHRGAFNPTNKMKQLIVEMMKYDPSLAIHSLVDDEALYPQYDKFPTKEADFEQYFYVHPILKRPIYRNQITIGCRLLSTKTINDIKKATGERTTMMDWLKKNNVFIEIDSLGRKTIRTIGYLFFLHPNMTHHVSLKGNLREALTEIRISKDKIEDIHPNAIQYFHFNETTIEEEEGDATITDATDADDDKLLPIPFELFPTSVGYGIGTTRVSTKALAIKCNVDTGAILHELFLRMQTDKNIYPRMQYVPVGTAQLLGPEPYKHLIMQNNAYLQSLATIPVLGITDTTLNNLIPVNNGTPGAKQAIRDVLMTTDWCLQIEPTQTTGRMLLITTKSNLDTGRQWLDTNLAPIFEIYLPRNADYVPDPDNPIPHRADIRPANAKLDSYADALRQCITLLPSTQNNNSAFVRPPPNRAPHGITVSYTQAARNATQQTTTQHNIPKKRKTRTTDNNSTTSDNSMETSHTQATISTVANLKHEIMTTLRQEIAQLIQTDVHQIQTDITSIQQTITSNNDQTKHDMMNFHQQLADSQALFQQQMSDMNRAFQHQMQVQQAQMAAFFQQFATTQPSSKPPPSSTGGGTH